ncbi:hypothetical protein [Alteromonas flava]|uniref:hypothetical protein n=1 Tax=Alteromonas flava TaxID=2048003 RepID=UPI000C282ADC|nr:hypothetical protein [Alteromonas flava]
MNWKSCSKKSFGVALGVFTLGFVLSASALKPRWQGNCEQQFAVDLQTQPTCVTKTNESIGWFDWIGGKSRSYQFHFLDLLELLYSNDSEHNDRVGSGPTSSL